MGIKRETEASFQAAVLQYARLTGWEWYHTSDSRKSPEGFPDLVLVRERVVYAELKTETGQPTTKQLHWQALLRAAGQDVYLWRPSDWPEILAVLTGTA